MKHLMKKASTLCLTGAAAAVILLLPVVSSGSSAQAASCYDLWHERNSIFARNGHCFRTAKARRVFGAGCFSPYGRLRGYDQRRVSDIKRTERAQRCGPGGSGGYAPPPPPSYAPPPPAGGYAPPPPPSYAPPPPAGGYAPPPPAGGYAPPPPAGGGYASMSCPRLWHARNSIFARNGYCFKTRRGRNAFGAGCYPPYGRLGGADQRSVDDIRYWERRNGCR